MGDEDGGGAAAGSGGRATAPPLSSTFETSSPPPAAVGAGAEGGGSSAAIGDTVDGGGGDSVAMAGGATRGFASAVAARLLGTRTAADRLPPILHAVATGGWVTALAFLGLYVALLLLWLPFWLLSFVATEVGVYALAVMSVFFVGRSVIRLIAFPGASQKVTSEIEAEFAKYSARIVLSSCDALAEVAAILASAFPVPANGGGGAAGESSQSQTQTSQNFPQQQQQRRRSSDLYDLPVYWRRAKTYRDRVLGVYLEVLLHLYDQPPLPTRGGGGGLGAASGSGSSSGAEFTRYGNNRLSGDIGNLHGLTPEARSDGRELMERLRKAMALIDEVERLAKPVLEAGLGPSTPNPLPQEAGDKARECMKATTELRDFAASLKPGPASGGGGAEDDEDETDEDLTVDAVRRKFEERGGTAIDAVRSGLASILPMLDPPPHTSIFGFDVQRGCMLSRYRGSRQFWVRRPNGGMIDVLHFPAPHWAEHHQHEQQQQNPGSSSRRTNPRAVLYCNPNAGLIEVVTGMSLVGGNLPGAETSSDSSWTDFYTQVS